MTAASDCSCSYSTDGEGNFYGITRLFNLSRARCTIDALSRSFPMYTVPLHTLMKMTKVEPHEVLQERDLGCSAAYVVFFACWLLLSYHYKPNECILVSEGSLTTLGDELVVFERKLGKAGFISHQWTSKQHPDPEFKQMRVLQDAMTHMLYKMERIPLDSISESAMPGAKPLKVSEMQSEPLFMWYDYFSCPQREADGNHIQLMEAIRSIPVARLLVESPVLLCCLRIHRWPLFLQSTKKDPVSYPLGKSPGLRRGKFVFFCALPDTQGFLPDPHNDVSF